MPLVRIDLQAGRSPRQVREIADTVQEVMLEVFAAPPGDRYQVITEHPAGSIIVEDSGIGIERTDGIVLISIVQQGRTTEQKVAAYAELSRRLHERCGVPPGDLVVSVVENTRADWSFGHGRAQFLTGEL